VKIRAGDLENRQTPTTPSSAMSLAGRFAWWWLESRCWRSVRLNTGQPSTSVSTVRCRVVSSLKKTTALALEFTRAAAISRSLPLLTSVRDE
jgi:hypothetical protein